MAIIVVLALGYSSYRVLSPHTKSAVKPVVSKAVVPIATQPLVMQVNEEVLSTAPLTESAKKISDEPSSRTEAKVMDARLSAGRVAVANVRTKTISRALPDEKARVVMVAPHGVSVPVAHFSEPRLEVTDLPTSANPRVPLSAEDKSSRQSLLDRAQYWEAHGRSDLAEAARNQLKKPERSTKAENFRTVPRVQTEISAAERPTSRHLSTSDGSDEPSPRVVEQTQQQLLDSSQYWESHGRSDLSAQIKQKLIGMETARPTANSVREESFIQTSGASSAARNALEDSLLKNPNSIQARLDLAQIYRSSGEMASARLQIDSVLKTNPDMPEALLSSAQLLSDQRLWMQTLYVLEKISPSARNAEMANLQKTAWAHVQIDRADTLVKQGNSAQAEVLLRQVALELAISAKQTPTEEPPSLWKNSVSKRTRKK